MAIYSSGSYGKRKDRNQIRIYVISVLIVIVLGIVFIYVYRPFGKGDSSSNEPVSPESTKTGLVAATPPVQAHLQEPNNLQIAPKPIAEPNSKINELIAKASAYLNETPAGIIEARDILNEVLPMPMSQQQRMLIKQRLSELSETWLFSKSLFQKDMLCGTYTVQPGDRLSKIADQFKVP